MVSACQLLDGQIAKVNTTLLTWLGYRRDQLVGRRHLSDLLTVGGRIYYETHLAPLVSMQGEVRGVALDLQAADGARLPVLITSVVKADASGEPILVRTTVFDARPLSQDRWGVALGDVCGKGAHAATVTSLIRYTLRTAAVYDASPSAVLGTLNAALHQRYARDNRSFCTAIFGVLTPDGEGFTLALPRGCHAAPLIMRASGTAGQVSVPGGPLIGVWDDAAFTTTTIRLSTGDTLLLFTDGLTDARTGIAGDSGRYGEEALHALARDLAPATAAAAISAMTALLEDLAGGLDDDTAILALGVPPARR